MQAQLLSLPLGAWALVAVASACATDNTEPAAAGVALEGGSGGAETAGGSQGGGGRAGSGGGAVASGGKAGTGGSGGAGGNPASGGIGGAGGGGAGGSAGGGSAGAGGMPNVAKPNAVSVGATKNNTPREGGDGGADHQDDCPQGQVLIGFKAWVEGADSNLKSLHGVCGTLSMGTSPPYAITTTEAASLPLRGDLVSIAETALCPANQIVVGFQGRIEAYVYALSFKCAPLSVEGASPSYVLTVGTAMDSDLIGGQTSGTPFNAINCAAGQVAVGQRLRTGGSVDNFGLACSALTLVVN